MKRTKNAGLTLVELLVSIAVLSIVTLGVGGLLRLAAEQYSNATKETEVQNLSQSVFASVSNSLEDVAIDVTFSGGRLTIVNNDGIILFEKDGDKLYYDEQAYTSLGVAADADNDAKKTAASSATIGKDEENLLADHVAVFSVDTSTKDQGFVVVSLTINHHERTKSMVQNVFMRNLRPKNLAVAANSTTQAPSATQAPSSTPIPTPITGPAGFGGITNVPSPTNAPSPTQAPSPTPTEEPTDYTSRISNITPGATKVTFTMKDENNGNPTTVKITKEGSNYKIDAGNNAWVIANLMPGYYDPGHDPLRPEQIKWLKDSCGIDVTTQITGGTEDPPEDPNGNGGTNPPGPLTVVQDTSATYSSNMTITKTEEGNNWTSITFELNPDGWNKASYTVIYRANEDSYTLILNDDSGNPWILQGGQTWKFDWVSFNDPKPKSYNVDAGIFYDIKTAFGLDLKATLNPQN